MMFWHTLSDLLLTQAEGQPPAESPFGGTIGTLIPLALMFVVIYFLLIRPANKQRKEHQQMLNALKKDDEVVTSGGIWGRIVNLEDKVATVEIADKVKIKILRDRIAGRWDPSKATPQQQR